MSYVIGTTGHVDHGKTTLIHALTGIQTQHLPEEKARGMTIDLGFAFLEDSTHGTIGIVDVPGHERFVRNMVAGTWGLNMALLVIAADDGWMQMSTEHLHILQAMHVERIILVINKCDLVDKEYEELIREDAQEKCRTILGRDIPTCCVSAETGKGIDNLIHTIRTELSTISPNTLPPKLYIDRVFTLKGIGTTITGTLWSGTIHKEQELTLSPGNHLCKIKTIHNHHKEVSTLTATSRAALNIKNVEKTEIQRGMMLCAYSKEILEGQELVVLIDQHFLSTHTKSKEHLRIQNHKEIEVALGSMHSKGFIHLATKNKKIARISLDSPVACTWNQPVALIQHGGHHILAACRVLEASSSFNKSLYKKIVDIYSTQTPPLSFMEFQFLLKGYMEGDIEWDSTLGQKEILHIGTWHILTSLETKIQKSILKTLKNNPTGCTIEEFALDIPKPLLASLLNKCVQEQKISKEDNRYCIPDLAKQITQEGKHILDIAQEAGRKGIEIDKLNIPGAKKEVRALINMKKLVLLEGHLCYHIDVFNALKEELLHNKNAGDIITIAQVRDSTGLSRKYVLPILNLLEQEGKLQRQDNDRVVL